MATGATKFQCYLILGDKNIVREKTRALLQENKIDIDKRSPDIFFITPAKQSISIDEVRNLKKHIFQKPVDLKYKIIIFEDAHKLTAEAQNSLLKILEEPPQNSFIILEAQNKENLLPTVRSRLVLISTKKDYQRIKDSLYLNASLAQLMATLPKIEDPQKWLDEQIVLVHLQMITDIKNKKTAGDLKFLTQSLDKCIYTKRMIAANINPSFALANLFLSTGQRLHKT